MSEFSFFKEIPVQKTVDEEVGTAEFPPILRQIESALGFDDAMKLVRKLGGLSITIPKDPDRTHLLTKAVGLEIAQKLARLFGGDSIAVPRAHHYRTVLRQAEVCRRYRSGESTRTLAKSYGLTERAVEKCVQRENLRRTKRRYNKIMGRKP